MSFGQVEGFFVDSCVLLPQPLETRVKDCQEFIKEASSKCILSSSVKKEALDLIDRAYKTIMQNFHSQLKPYLEKKSIKVVTNRDGQVFADFFINQKNEFKKLPYRKSNIQYEILGAMESYVASAVHSIANGEKISIDIFWGAISVELSIRKNSMEKPFKGLRCENIEPGDSLISAVVLGSILKNADDVVHLSSALQYQFVNNKWVIFVTMDQEDILNKSTELKEIFLQCSRPEWALDYFRDLTRNKAPVEHTKEIKALTVHQQMVLKAISEINTKNVEEPAKAIANKN